MKLIIDIPEGVYNLVVKQDWDGLIANAVKKGTPYEERPTGGWIVTAEDNEGVHRIQCPFCGYEKGSDFVDYITVTFERMPPFCENCGARLEAENE